MKHANEGRYCSIVDMITVFWHSHRRTVKLFLNTMPHDVRAYVYTSVALRVEYKDIYPFATFGDLHILEDPLIDAFRNSTSLYETGKLDYLKGLIENVMPVHIEVLENYMYKVLILPIGFRTTEESQEIYDFCSRSFFSMFRENYTDIKDYLSKVNTVEDIYSSLKEEYRDNEFYFSKDNIKEWLEFRIIDNANDAFAYYNYTTSNRMRACVITFNYLQFGITPYIPNLTILRNTIDTLGFFAEQSEKDYLIFKMVCGHALYRAFPEDMENISFEEYCNLLANYDLVQDLDDYYDANRSRQIMPNDIYTEIQKFFEKVSK